MNLGEKIYQLRTEKNLSQGDLADRLDVSRQSVSKWENNTAVPDLDKLIKICDIFEISLDELTGRENPKEKSTNKMETIKNSLTKAQLVGCILIGVAIISLVIPFGIYFTPVILICGMICLAVKKNPWYWCVWAVFLPLLFIMNWGIAGELSDITRILFLIITAVTTYIAFKDTEIVIPRNKAILILILSVAFDLIYILFHMWNMGLFGEINPVTTVILENGQTVISGQVTSGLWYGIMNMLLTAGVGLSYIGIFLSAKNLRKNK